MSKHIDLLGIFYIVWGAITALAGAGVVLVAVGFGSAAMINSAAAGDHGSGLAAGLLAVLFTLVAIVSFAWGALAVAAGVALRRHRSWARVVTIALSILNLLVVPIGTALGIYALWVLLSDQSRLLFERPTAA